MDLKSHRDLRVLEAVAADGGMTQRRLAEQVGIALGLANLYVKRLVRKGYIKCTNVQRNRVRYLITPTGVAEKTRLTYEYMEYSLHVYRDARQRLRSAIGRRVNGQRPRTAIFGTGEAAELAYLCLKELGLEPVAVFDVDAGDSFLGMPVQSIGSHRSVEYDFLVVATMTDPAPVLDMLHRRGIAGSSLVLLHG